MYTRPLINMKSSNHACFISVTTHRYIRSVVTILTNVGCFKFFFSGLNYSFQLVRINSIYLKFPGIINIYLIEENSLPEYKVPIIY